MCDKFSWCLSWAPSPSCPECWLGTSWIDHLPKNPLLKVLLLGNQLKTELWRLNDKSVCTLSSMGKVFPNSSYYHIISHISGTFNTIPGTLMCSINYTKWSYVKSHLVTYASNLSTLTIHGGVCIDLYLYHLQVTPPPLSISVYFPLTTTAIKMSIVFLKTRCLSWREKKIQFLFLRSINVFSDLLST